MTTVKIEYGCRPNAAPVGGFLPALWINGRSSGSTYSGTTYDVAEALALAERQASEEAARYIGDWIITVTQRTG